MVCGYTPAKLMEILNLPHIWSKIFFHTRSIDKDLEWAQILGCCDINALTNPIQRDLLDQGKNIPQHIYNFFEVHSSPRAI